MITKIIINSNTYSIFYMDYSIESTDISKIGMNFYTKKNRLNTS
jgi:hypothetical protein